MALSPRTRGLLVLVAAVLGVGIALRLAVWQLDRAAQKVEIQSRIEARAMLSAVDAGSLAHSPAEAVDQHYRHAALVGRWSPQHTVFLENRQVDGRPGFHVLTPLLLDGRPDAVVVQRGWAPRNFLDRAVLPVVPTPPGVVRIEGLIAPPPSRLYEFSPAVSGPIRQNIDLAAFSDEIGLRLAPVSVLQADSAATAGDGLVRKWPLRVLDPQKNYGYALQWFALGALIAGLYVWFQLIRPLRRRA